MASRYFASPSESEAAINPLYSTLHVHIRSKYSCDRASCQSPTLRIALPTATGSSEADKSVAIGPPSSGSSPKCRELSFAIPANCCGVACSYDTCCAAATCGCIPYEQMPATTASTHTFLRKNIVLPQCRVQNSWSQMHRTLWHLAPGIVKDLQVRS